MKHLILLSLKHAIVIASRSAYVNKPRKPSQIPRLRYYLDLNDSTTKMQISPLTSLVTSLAIVRLTALSADCVLYPSQLYYPGCPNCYILYCPANCPSESGNHQGENADCAKYLARCSTPSGPQISLRRTCSSLLIEELPQSSNTAFQASQINITETIESALSKRLNCCQPTWECYHFMENDIPQRIGDIDIMQWVKMVCCFADVLTPSSRFENPPNILDITFYEPPACAEIG
jgi:hypothetical protein